MQALNFPLPLLIGALVGGSLVATSNFILYAYAWILPEVNALLPPGQKITPFMLNFRIFELLDRHAKLAPKSKLRILMILLFALGSLFGLVGLILSLPWIRK
jgi:hypothetical protein